MSVADPIRPTLAKLVLESGSNFTADDVLREFRCTKDKRSDRKLLKILENISKNKPHQKEHLEEAARLLQRKDPMYVLLVFVNHYKSTPEALDNMLQAARKEDISTSTPKSVVFSETNNDMARAFFVPGQQHNSDVTTEAVMEIKERVLVAASSSSSSGTRSSNMQLGASPSVKNLKSNVFNPTTDIPDGYRTDALWDFHKMDLNGQKPEIGATPKESQESLLLHDLIYCLMGVRGCYIKPEATVDPRQLPEGEKFSMKFEMTSEIQSSLADLAQEILPLASHYICIQKLVHIAQEEDAGQVLQALSSALNELTHDYYMLLAQLESELMDNKLTLHKMFFYVRPTMNIMEIISDTLIDVITINYRGAPVLTLLYNKVNSLTGDEESQKFIIDLTQQAAVPYMNILQLWIQKGIIVDPYQEFLVEDNEVIRREELPEHYSADYWEKRYTIRRERIPCFLENVADIILRTGKYLNVIRQCGKKDIPSQTMQLVFKPTSDDHIKIIEDAYHFASKTLLDVLLKENDLMGHLMSVKRYLLLNQGDFIMQFMDACEEELSKNVDQVLPTTLENLLGLTLRLSSARNDPYKDDLHCELLTYDLVTQMSKIMSNEEEYWQINERLDLNGLECFAFTYEVKWPISLVLNHIAISKYQMLFRQLFYCKHVERQLCKIWKENSIAKKFSPQAAELYRSAFALRHRMKNAIQNLEYYMMIEIIEPNWHTFIQRMQKVGNVDEVFSLHQDFLDSCLKNCMLTESVVLNRSIFKLCNICLKFCEFIQRSQRFFLDAELKSMVCDSNDDNTDNSDSEHDFSSQKQLEVPLVPTETFSERVKRFDLEFTGLLIGFLKQINDAASENSTDCFMNLVHRMNFNYFYSDQMEKLCAKDAMLSTHH